MSFTVSLLKYGASVWETLGHLLINCLTCYQLMRPSDQLLRRTTPEVSSNRIPILHFGGVSYRWEIWSESNKNKIKINKDYSFAFWTVLYFIILRNSSLFLKKKLTEIANKVKLYINKHIWKCTPLLLVRIWYLAPRFKELSFFCY